jgi:hypothetical protein
LISLSLPNVTFSLRTHLQSLLSSPVLSTPSALVSFLRHAPYLTNLSPASLPSLPKSSLASLAHPYLLVTSSCPLNIQGASPAPIRDLHTIIDEMSEPTEAVELDLERVRDIRYIQVISEMIAHGEANSKRVVIRGNEK